MAESWQRLPLGSVAREHREMVSVKHGVSYPTVGVMRDGRGLLDREPFVGGKTNYKVLNRIRQDQLVLRSITAWEAPIAVVGATHDGYHVSGVFPVFELDKLRLLPEFMALVCQSPNFWAEMRQRSVGTVLRRKTLSASALLGIEIDLPSLREQRRIADLMQAVDQYITMVTRVATAAGLTRATTIASHAPSSDLTVGDIVQVARAGGTPSRKILNNFGGDVPWVKSGEVNAGRVDSTEETISKEGLAASSAWLVPAGAVLVAMYGATAGATGYLATPMATNQAVLSLIAEPAYADQRFLYHWLHAARDRMKARAIGAAQPNLSKERVLAEPFPPLDLASQASVGRLCDAFENVGQEAQAVVGVARYVRSALISELLSGSRRLLDTYDSLLEPAS